MALGARRSAVALELGADCLLLATAAAALASLAAGAVARSMGSMAAGPVAPFGFSVSAFRSEGSLWLLVFLTLLGAAGLCSVAASKTASRASLVPLLSQGSGIVPGLGPHRHAGIRWLSGVQAIISLLIVASGVLFVQTLRASQNKGPRFDLAGLFQFTIHPADVGIQGPASHDLTDGLLQRLRNLPEVASVSDAATPLLSNFRASAGIKLLDPETGRRPDMVALNLVGPGYLGTIGAHLISGRDFSEADERSRSHVVLLSEAAATRLSPAENIVGRRITFSNPPVPETTFTVVGTYRDLEREAGPGTALVLDAAAPPMMNYARSLGVSFILRARGGLSRAMSAARRMVANSEPRLGVVGMASVQATLDASRGPQRLAAWLGAGLSLLALALAAVSTLGQCAVDVAHRRREMGIRIALGASPARVVGLVTANNALASALGLGAGAAVVLLGSRLLGHYLADLPQPPGADVVVAVLALLACAVAGALVPAITSVARGPSRSLRLD
jgi:hypothetical protein